MRAGIWVSGCPFGHTSGYFGARAPIWAHGRSFWCPGTHLGMWMGILVPGCLFKHVGGHFSARLATREVILVPGRLFGNAGGHFGARVHVWAHEQLPV